MVGVNARGDGAGPGGRRITVHGHCMLPERQIAARIESGGVASLVDAPGHFVIVSRGRDGEIIVCSRSGIVGYFATVSDHEHFVHGPDVATVIEAAGLPMAWDHAAVADLLVFGHPLGTATMHPKVRRLPAGSVTFAENGILRRCAEVPAPEVPEGRVPAAVAVAALVESVAQDAPGDCALSMSGGLDSRLLLAALVALGRSPHLVVSGIPGSFDREVAGTIGRNLGLACTPVVVTAQRVAATLTTIARPANGVIPAGNWAGLLHLRCAPVPELPVLLGFNGELARCYYAPASGLGLLAAARSAPQGGAAVLLGHRFASPFRPGERRLLAAGLAEALEPAQVAARLAKAVSAPGRPGPFLMADRLFLEHYGRQKIGHDLAVIGGFARWRIPLSGTRFVNCVRRLPLSWKVGDRFHRYAIGRLCPPLLAAADEGYGPRTSRHVPWRYWVRGPAPSRLPFFLDHSIFRSECLLDQFTLHREALAGLVDPELIDRLAIEQAQRPSRPNAAFGLLALAIWRAAVGTPSPPRSPMRSGGHPR